MERNDNQDIEIVVAIMFDPANRLLAVRKKGSSYYQLPGGKIWANETKLAALQRELKEELGVDLPAEDFRFIATEKAEAVNEKGRRVRGHVFRYTSRAEVAQIQALAEIEEVQWIRQDQWETWDLANLLRKVVPSQWSGFQGL